MRRFLLPLLLVSWAFALVAQDPKFNHVQWKLTLEPASAAPGATVLGRLEATVDPEWHMYSLTTPPGPIPTTIVSKDSPAGTSPIAKFTIFEPPAIRKFDPSFNTDTETYEGSQVFFARIELKKDLQPGPVTISFVPRYQTCSGTQCIPPRTRQVSAALNIVAGAPAAAVTTKASVAPATKRANNLTRISAL